MGGGYISMVRREREILARGMEALSAVHMYLVQWVLWHFRDRKLQLNQTCLIPTLF